MSKNLKTSIVEHLKKKGNYEPDVDDYLIDMILYNIDYANEMRQILKTEGCVVHTPNGNGISSTKMNPAFGILQMCQRNIHQAAARLGINRSDRQKLKIEEQRTADALDDIIGL